MLSVGTISTDGLFWKRAFTTRAPDSKHEKTAELPSLVLICAPSLADYLREFADCTTLVVDLIICAPLLADYLREFANCTTLVVDLIICTPLLADYLMEFADSTTRRARAFGKSKKYGPR